VEEGEGGGNVYILMYENGKVRSVGTSKKGRGEKGDKGERWTR
jgi:hypothetical protein